MDWTNSVRRREYLKVTGVAAASTVGIAGCLGTDERTGTLATTITDQPGDIADFESCVVTIRGVWVGPREESDDEDGDEAGDEDGDEGDDEDGDDAGTGSQDDEEDDADGELDEQDETDVDRSDGRQYLEFDEPQEADLVDLQGENTQLIDERELAVGTYAFLQLDVTEVDGTLADGGDAEVSTPGDAPLQFNEPFDVREGERTTFVGDFTPVRRGRTDRYLLQPVATGTKVSYEGDEEGSSGVDDDPERDEEV